MSEKEEIRAQITDDLMTKVVDDVSDALKRTLSIAPLHLPVALAAAAVCLGYASNVLSRMHSDDNQDNSELTEDISVLAALLAVRGVEAGYADLQVLIDAGRITPGAALRRPS